MVFLIWKLFLHSRIFDATSGKPSIRWRGSGAQSTVLENRTVKINFRYGHVARNAPRKRNVPSCSFSTARNSNIEKSTVRVIQVDGSKGSAGLINNDCSNNNLTTTVSHGQDRNEHLSPVGQPTVGHGVAIASVDTRRPLIYISFSFNVRLPILRTSRECLWMVFRYDENFLKGLFRYLIETRDND